MSRTMIRTFIAVKVPPTPPLRKVLHRLGEVGRSVKPVEIEKLHLTLKFLGDVPPERIPEIAQALTKSVDDHSAFDVQLAGTGAYPDLRRPTVIWAGVQGGEPLGEIAEALEEELADCGFPRERRPFSPHLTLARVKSKPPAELFDIVETFSTADYGTVSIKDVIVYQSELQSTGPTYTPLAVVDLK